MISRWQLLLAAPPNSRLGGAITQTAMHMYGDLRPFLLTCYIIKYGL
jgi:hypothetical protein